MTAHVPVLGTYRDLCPGLGIDDRHGSSVSMFGSCSNEAVQDAISTCRRAVNSKEYKLDTQLNTALRP